MAVAVALALSEGIPDPAAHRAAATAGEHGKDKQQDLTAQPTQAAVPVAALAELELAARAAPAASPSGCT